MFLLGETPSGLTKDGIGGITRLQKYLFLLENEEGIKPEENDFEFEAYKVGPYSSKLYDDLEFLENSGLIEGNLAGEATEEEATEIDMMSFDDFINDEDTKAADAYEERKYSLTEKGLNFIKEKIYNEEYKPAIEGIRKIKSKFGYYSLTDLLLYVYSKYPEMTIESEIKEKILRRRQKL